MASEKNAVVEPKTFGESAENNVKDETQDKATVPALDKFTLFPKLPAEMRLKIWKEACCVMRNVDLWLDFYEVEMRGDLEDCCCCGDCDMVEDGLDEDGEMTYRHLEDHELPGYGEGSLDDRYTMCQQFLTQSRPPAVLGANAESRKEALKHYNLEFGVDKEYGDGFRHSTVPKIYINWKCDRLCLMNFNEFGEGEGHFGEESEDLFKICEARGLKSIAYNVLDELDDDWEFRMADRDYYFPRNCEYFNGLKEMIFFEVEDPRICKPEALATLEFVDLTPQEKKYGGYDNVRLCQDSVGFVVEEEHKEVHVRPCKLVSTLREK